MRTACMALGLDAKLTTLEREKWEPWRNRPTPELAAAVQKVVTDLDAEHLRPTGIEERLIAGVQPACHGLFTLLQNMQPPPTQSE